MGWMHASASSSGLCFSPSARNCLHQADRLLTVASCPGEQLSGPLPFPPHQCPSPFCQYHTGFPGRPAALSGPASSPAASSGPRSSPAPPVFPIFLFTLSQTPPVLPAAPTLPDDSPHHPRSHPCLAGSPCSQGGGLNGRASCQLEVLTCRHLHPTGVAQPVARAGAVPAGGGDAQLGMPPPLTALLVSVGVGLAPPLDHHPGGGPVLVVLSFNCFLMMLFFFLI